jgi:hypothetical protein
MTRKFGEQNYDLGRFLQRGLHELANALYPESQIPVRENSGLYGDAGKQMERAQPQPRLERDQPELER